MTIFSIKKKKREKSTHHILIRLHNEQVFNIEQVNVCNRPITAKMQFCMDFHDNPFWKTFKATVKFWLG